MPAESSLTPHESGSIPWHFEKFLVDKLMLSFVNKLATAVTRTGRQYSVMGSNFQTESLIEVLSLQVTTQSKIRLTADNLMSFVFENLVAEECMPVDHLI